MIREFFCKSQKLVAFAGLVVIVSHAALHACLKYAVNKWYGEFYDLLEDSGRLASNMSTTNTSWIQKQNEVSSSLLDFVKLATVAVAIMPLTKFIRSAWTLRWRIALMSHYIEWHNPNLSPIEGMSQRIHEDSYRFAKGVELCLTTVLDAVVTLAVFVPVLANLGSDTLCPSSLRALRWLGDAWLVGLATSSAALGLFVTLLLGHRLVGLEVANQKVEAELRKDLVMLETNPSLICPTLPCSSEDPIDNSHTIFLKATAYFVPSVRRIYQNYMALFVNFGILNLWLAAFDQMNLILPYAIFAPMLFEQDPNLRITLGILVQVSNSFDKVFGALSVVSENWGQVNEFRSVIRRLGQYERKITTLKPNHNKRKKWFSKSSDTQNLVSVEIATTTQC